MVAFSQGLMQFGITVAALLGAQAAPAEPVVAGNPQLMLEGLRRHDAALARIGFVLTTANAPLCDERMPGTGLVLHAIDQYPAALRPVARVAFGFPSPLAIELVVEDSPARRAGIHAGQGIAAIGMARFDAALAPGAPQSTALRDRAEGVLALLPEQSPLPLELVRGAETVSAVIRPEPACRVRFELVPDAGWLAQSDGKVIQLATRYAERLDDTELAVVVAHELAHAVLHHRRRLVAAGVGKGLFAEFGRSGRLTRQVEDEADRLSVVLLRNAGYDPAAGPRFWRKWGGELGGGPFRKRTHASAAARGRMMEAEIARIPFGAPKVYLPPLLATRDTPLG